MSRVHVYLEYVSHVLELLTRYRSVVSTHPIKVSRCFVEQEHLPSYYLVLVGYRN